MSADSPFRPFVAADQVLLVEDSEFFTKVVTKGIEERHGIKVISAKSMAEAKVLIERHRSNFFLALLDLTLPDAPDGEIVDYVATKGIPAAIFSSRFDDELRARVFAQTNVVDYILKKSPAGLHYLVNMVGRLYRNRGVPVLVVDDSAITRQKTFTLLTLQQFEVHSAANAKEALRLLEQNPGIRLVVTDFGMPGMNGAELTAAIREKHSVDEIAVIGVSSTGTRQTSALFIKSGANDFLSEPFLPEEFLCRVSQNIELIDKIRELKAAANTDFFTGLYNRRFFFEAGHIVFARARRAGTPIAVAMIDIDFFKKINDAFGHDTGDAVLKHLAAIMRARARRTDIVARVGGEEFCILFEDADPLRLPEVLESLRAAVADADIDFEGRRPKMTVSIGAWTRSGDSLDDMIRRADDMLYRAKQTGRNRVVIDQDGVEPAPGAPLSPKAGSR
jgi:diguanylate cyclase (GGDEF)-like protein